jgi:hypothetical protein
MMSQRCGCCLEYPPMQFERLVPELTGNALLPDYC